jgi:hypothetical protein
MIARETGRGFSNLPVLTGSLEHRRMVANWQRRDGVLPDGLWEAVQPGGVEENPRSLEYFQIVVDISGGRWQSMRNFNSKRE